MYIFVIIHRIVSKSIVIVTNPATRHAIDSPFVAGDIGGKYYGRSKGIH